MKLFNYYIIDECLDVKSILKELDIFKSEGKIEYDLDLSTDVFKIEDLDLEDKDVCRLIELFEDNDIYPYLDKDDDDDDDVDNDNEDFGYYDGDDDY